jgi:hypothetical protein
MSVVSGSEGPACTDRGRVRGPEGQAETAEGSGRVAQGQYGNGSDGPTSSCQRTPFERGRATALPRSIPGDCSFLARRCSAGRRDAPSGSEGVIGQFGGGSDSERPEPARGRRAGVAGLGAWEHRAHKAAAGGDRGGVVRRVDHAVGIGEFPSRTGSVRPPNGVIAASDDRKGSVASVLFPLPSLPLLALRLRFWPLGEAESRRGFGTRRIVTDCRGGEGRRDFCVDERPGGAAR